MAEDWDAPPIATKGDANTDMTMAAVGRAMSAWESVELDLAMLYSAFAKGNLFNFPAWQIYGEGGVFNSRLAKLEAAAEAYFQKNPNQAWEGRFFSLVIRVRNFASRRHDIAHGILGPVSMPDGSTFWCVLPPIYVGRRYSGTPQYHAEYAYTAVEIDQIVNHFNGLNILIRDLASEIAPQNPSQGIQFPQ